ncbi:ABC transporter permease [Pseudomonas sp. R5(2019)]|uniref:ABC transporter permease n=1 Tax=Pseudomonas sp. R5(2019) TaxID=2697566 RepID=UPI0014120183|nr:ABC transporter permease [Pseudomonas sp. R5(2019)]NBA95226.1 FtsX-like permease family protein [Pseudomonas sp. R5(2019)]
MSALVRGCRNPFRNRFRSAVVVLLLALVIGLFAVLVQGALATREKLESLQAGVRTVVELREAGAFGTGGFGGDKPVGAEDFSVARLDEIQRIPNARYIKKVEEYIHSPQIDPSVPNAYAMVIGLRPGSPMRAIGEVDYENARIEVGRAFSPADEGDNVAIVGKLYARERLRIADGYIGAAGPALAGKTLMLDGQPLQVVGIYSTGNDFGDNHVFVPLETFRRILKPGGKLSKIRVTVDAVDHVEAVTADLQRLKGVDAVTAAEQIATARATLGSISAATVYGSLLLFTIGGVLVVFIMVLSTRERISEIGTLKAIGASNAEVVKQFLAEVFTLTGLGAVGAVVVSAVFSAVFHTTLDVELQIGPRTFALIALGGLAFGALGSLYPIVKGMRLSPIQAMKST